MVVEDKDGGFGEAVFDGWVFEKFGEEHFGGSVDDDIAVGAEIELVFDARPIGKVAKVFRNVDGAIEGDLWSVRKA